MRLCIQRVKHSSVEVEGQIIGEIGEGLTVLIGVTDQDSQLTAEKMLEKCMKLRIFADENGKTNLDLNAVEGSLLLISQFTLYADCRKGNRPSFIRSGSPDHAKAIYEYMLSYAREHLGETRVAAGSFGADMMVRIENDGPFTIWLDSEELGIE